MTHLDVTMFAGSPGIRSLCSAGAATAALAVVVAVTGGSMARAAVHRSPNCTTGTLVAWLDTNGTGAAGSTYVTLELTNLSGHRCTLAGYPGVSAVDLVGRQLGSAAAHSPQTRPARVRLGAGRTASAVLRVSDTGVFAKASCRPVMAAGLRVYPPNETRSKVVPYPFRACMRAGPVYLHVQPVTAAR